MLLRWLAGVLRSGTARALLCFALLSGCKSFGDRRSEDDDPIRGQYPATPPAPGKLAANDPLVGVPAASSSAELPPMPAPSSALSVAALNGVNQTLDPHPPPEQFATLTSSTGPPGDILLSHPLPADGGAPAVAASDQNPVAFTGQVLPADGDPSHPGSLPPATSFPQAAPPQGVSFPAASSPPPGLHSASLTPTITSFPQAVQELTGRGMIDNHFEEIGPDDWRFDCTIRDPRHPANVRGYSATALGEHGLNAVRAVLTQIDQDPSR